MAVVGVVLAGGAARRMGGDKARARAGGVPLLHLPLRALAAVSARRAVVAKPTTRLPALPPGVERWNEPATAHHPLVGIVHALRRAGGEPVLCCALDLPLLDGATLQRLLDADPGGAGVVVPWVAGRPEPLCALWRPAALAVLEDQPAGAAMHAVIAAVGARRVPFEDARPFTNLNTLAELAAYPNVKA